MKFVFLKNSIQKILERDQTIHLPSFYIKKFGPYALSLVFDPNLSYSQDLQKHFNKNCNQDSFLNIIANAAKQKNNKFQSNASMECLACALIVDNPNLQDSAYMEEMNPSNKSEAAQLAYSLCIQKIKGWPLIEEAKVLNKLEEALKGPPDTHQFSKIQSLQFMLSDLSRYYPQLLKYLQGKAFHLDLPLDFFLKTELKDAPAFFFEDDILIDLKYKGRIYSINHIEEFTFQPLRTFLQRYYKLALLSKNRDVTVIWSTKNTTREEIVEAILAN